MKKFIKCLVFLKLAIMLSVFIGCKDKFFFSQESQITIETEKCVNKILNIKYKNKELNKQENQIKKEFYTLLTKEKEIELTLVSQKAMPITLTLLNPQEKNLLKYNPILINDAPVFKIPQKIDTQSPYDYTFIPKKGKEYKIKIQWEVID